MESSKQPVEVNQRFKMAWTAYVRPAVVLLIMIAIGSLLTSLNGRLGGVFIAFWVGLFIVQILSIRALVLYTDSHGVWVYSGIFPWSKGISGVKWRDVEDASYVPNFSSWLFKSYTIRIGHRFTKSSEIVLPHMRLGHDAVMHINDFHRSALAGHAIEGMA